MGGSECHAQIFDSHRPAARIQVEKDKTQCVGEGPERGIGQAWHDGLDELEAEEFQFVAQALEARYG